MKSSDAQREEALERALLWLSTDRQPEIERDLRELVELSSHTPDRAGVTAVAARYAEQLASLCPSGALSIERKPSTRHGDHLVARTAATGPRVLLIGHHD